MAAWTPGDISALGPFSMFISSLVGGHYDIDPLPNLPLRIRMTKERRFS